MREGRSSFTAAVVTAARYVGTRDRVLARVCQDALAQRMLPLRVQRVAGLMQVLPVDTFGVARRLSLGLVDHIALRTHHIDRVLAASVAEGVRQVMILGAGFDTRAFRMPALALCQLYEVDHPATQSVKRERSRDLPLSAAGLHYVACDFRHTRPLPALLEAGFDPRAPCVCIWEGVTMYLDEPSVRNTLAELAEMCARGSTLISTYVRPELVSGGALWARVGRAVLFGAAEPIAFVSAPNAYRALLAQYGWSLRDDSAPEAIANLLGVQLVPVRVGMPAESIAVALRVAHAG
jgi:methyltransferase (TIGR00027 family)